MPIMARQPAKGTLTQSLAVNALARSLPALVTGGARVRRSVATPPWDPGLRAVLQCDRIRQDHGYAPVWLRFAAGPALLVVHRTDVRAVIDGFSAPFARALPHLGSSPRAAKRPKGSALTEHLVDTVLSVATRSPRLAHVAQQRVTELTKDARHIDARRWRLLLHKLAWNVIFGSEDAADAVVDDRSGTTATAGTYARQGQLVHSQLRHCAPQAPGRLWRDDAVMLAAARQLAMTVTQLCDRAARYSFHALQLLSVRPPVCVGPGYMAASLREASRLWPEAPASFRQTTRDTRWGGKLLPEGSRILVMNLFGHRDRRRISFADDFAPSVWLPGGHAISDPLFNGFGHGRHHEPSEEFGVQCGAGLLSAAMNAVQMQPVLGLHDDAGRMRHTAPPDRPIVLA